MPHLTRSIAGMFCVLVLSAVAPAQFDTGRITGIVYDPDGGVVPDATIVVKNTGTGTKAESDDTGNFSVTALPLGDYVVSGTASGFETATSASLRLNVGATVNVVLQLPVGAIKEVVTVTGTAGAVQTGSSEIGNTILGRQVQDLPLNGRDVTAYISLAPGSVQTGPNFRQSMNGFETTFTGINILLDGSDATRVEWNRTNTNTGGQGSRITRASVDSIEEVKVMQGSYKSEYGRSLGAVVNMVTKSGTNEFHGGVFEYFRNEALDARNFFDRQPKTRQEGDAIVFDTVPGEEVWIGPAGQSSNTSIRGLQGREDEYHFFGVKHVPRW